MHTPRHYRGGYPFAGSATLARKLRKEQTSAEELRWALLRNRQLLGFKFRRQHQVGDYVADFYCRKPRLVFECAGAVHEKKEQWQHDQKRESYMISQRLRVLRFPNERVLNEVESVLDQIATCLTNSQLSDHGRVRE